MTEESKTPDPQTHDTRVLLLLGGAVLLVVLLVIFGS